MERIIGKKGSLKRITILSAVSVLCMAVLVYFIISVFAINTITDSPNNPASGTLTSNNNLALNWNITDNGEGLDFFKFSWNGTNSTLHTLAYDPYLFLFYKMDNDASIGESATLIKDLSYHGGDGTISGGATWNSTGKYGGAYNFDGTNDYVLTGYINYPNTSLTFSMWAYPFFNPNGINNTNDGSNFLFKMYSASTDYIQVSFYNNSATSNLLLLQKSGGTNFNTTTNLNQSQWFYFVLVCNFQTNVTSLYINGENIANSTASWMRLGNSSHRYMLGVNWDRTWNGMIDEVMIFNRTLSNTEIAKVYSAEISKYKNSSLNQYETGNYTFSVNKSNLTDGIYSYYFCSSNTTGSEVCSASRTIEIDAQPMNITGVTTPTGSSSNLSAIIEYNISAHAQGLSNINWSWDNVNSSLTNGLVSVCNFDNRSALGESNTQVHCWNKNGGFNGSVAGGSILNLTEGVHGSGAFELDGVNDYINITSANNYMNNSFSFCMWVNVRSFISAKTLYSMGQSWDSFLWMPFDANQISLRIYKNSSSSECSTSLSSLSTATWYHVCGVYVYSETGNCSLYINERVATDSTVNSSKFNFNDTHMMIGSLTAGASVGNFTIDNFMFFNRSLSASEIDLLYRTDLKKYDAKNYNLRINQTLNYSVSRLNSSSTTYNNNYYLCSSNSSGSEVCSTQKTLTQTIPNEVMTANFSTSNGFLVNNPFGFNIHSVSYFTTDSQSAWHREKWENIGNEKFGRIDQGLNSFWGGYFNPSLEDWANTSTTFTNAQKIEMPFGWDVYGQFGNGTAYRTADAHSGSYALQINSTTSSAIYMYRGQGHGTGDLMIKKGAIYNFSFWAKGQGSIYLYFQDAENGFASCFSSSVGTLTSSWQLFSGSCNTSSSTWTEGINSSISKYKLAISSSAYGNLTIDDINITENGVQLSYWITNESLITTWQTKLDYLISTNTRPMIITSYMIKALANFSGNCYTTANGDWTDCPPKDNDMWGKLNQYWWDYVTENGTRYNMSMFLDESWNEPEISFFMDLLSSNNVAKTQPYIDMTNATFYYMNKSYPEVTLLAPALAGDGCLNPAQYYMMNASITNFSIYPQFEISGHCYQTPITPYWESGVTKLKALCSQLGKTCNGVWWDETNVWRTADGYAMRNTTSRFNEWESNFVTGVTKVWNSYPDFAHLGVYQWTDNCVYGVGCGEYPDRFSSVSSPTYENTTFPPYWAFANLSVFCPDGSEILNSSSSLSNITILSCKKGNMKSLIISSIETTSKNETINLTGSGISNLKNGATTYDVSSGILNLIVDPYKTFYLTEDLQAPSITIDSPISGYNYSSNTTYFNLTLDEEGSWCGYSLDGSANISMTKQGVVFDFMATNTSMSDKIHTVTFSCNDTFNNRNSTTISFTTDVTNPNATLIFPSNNSYNSTTTQNLTANLSDAVSLKNATIYVYNESGFYNSTFFQFASGVKNTIIGAVNNFIDGIYTFFVKLFDTSGNSYTTINNTFTIDSTAPTVTLISPEDGTQDTDEVVRFLFRVYDVNDVDNCSLYYQSGLYSTLSNITNNATNLIEVVSINNQHVLYSDDLKWYVRCTDELGNIGNSSIYDLDTRPDTQGGGVTTGGGGTTTGTTTTTTGDQSQNPKFVDVLYPETWNRGTEVKIRIKAYNQSEGVYAPKNLTFQFSINGVSLMETSKTDDGEIIATFKVSNSAELGSKTIRAIISDQRTITKDMTFEIDDGITTSGSYPNGDPLDEKFQWIFWIIIGMLVLVFFVLLIVAITRDSKK